MRIGGRDAVVSEAESEEEILEAELTRIETRQMNLQSLFWSRQYPAYRS